MRPSLCVRGFPVPRQFDPAGPPVDLLLSIEYEHILTAVQLARASGNAINLHMSPLPDYRGAGQCSFAILNQEKEFGTTFHFMVAKVDAGAILAQQRFAIEPAWTVQDLYEKTTEELILLFKENLAPLIHGQLAPQQQCDFPRDGQRRFTNAPISLPTSGSIRAGRWSASIERCARSTCRATNQHIWSSATAASI